MEEGHKKTLLDRIHNNNGDVNDDDNDDVIVNEDDDDDDDDDDDNAQEQLSLIWSQPISRENEMAALALLHQQLQQQVQTVAVVAAAVDASDRQRCFSYSESLLELARRETQVLSSCSTWVSAYRASISDF